MYIVHRSFLSSFNYVVLIIWLVYSIIEVSGVIHGKYTENIKQYHLAVPHKTTSEGEFSTFHLSHFHDYDSKQFMKRRKRDLDDPDAVHYGISLDNKLHHIELWPNRDFLHPQAVFEKRDPTLEVHKRDVRSIKNKKMCYYIGKVRGVDNSKAAISTCDGLTGYVHIGKNMYFIEPVHEHVPNAEGHHLHVIYPPTDAVENFCGVKDSPEDWEIAIKNRLRDEYKNGKNIFKRQGNYEVVPQWMEVMVVCDKKMTLKHKGKRDIEQWVLTIMSTVKSYYSDGSMTGVLQPVLVRVVTLEKEEEEIDLDIKQNCDYTLANFCNWVAKLQPKDETHPNHFDVAALLSDWDFCDKTGDCNTQGLAFLGGACAAYKFNNCQLNEDRGMLTTVIVSHEQGHLIGMSHDGPQDSGCPKTDPIDNSWYVMCASGHLYTVRWSPCSTASMRQLAEAHMLDCFNDEPTNDEYPLMDPVPGVLYGEDEQCRMAARDDPNVSGACHTGDPDTPINCSKSRCMEKDVCYTYGRDLADGTTCGKNKWCFKRVCEEKGTRPKALDGGWGEWGEWSTCTKSCNRGIQFKERLCDNPKPENHGKYCIGDKKEFRICNPQDCPPDAPSFRMLECKRLLPSSIQVYRNITKPENLIAPGYDMEVPCSLFCVVKPKKRLMISKAIADGAKCEIGNPLKLCISGTCTEVKCDNKFTDSTAVEDECGVCNGDGTMCKKVEGQNDAAASGYVMVAVVPAGAKKVKMEELEPSSNALAMGLPDGHTVLFNNQMNKLSTAGIFPFNDKRRDFFLYGRKVDPAGGNALESIVWDWTREDTGLYIGHKRSDIRTTVRWSWIEPTDIPTREAKYRWEVAEYKECSAKCDGGTQEPIISCYEEVGGRVSDKFCEKLDKPKEETKKCNQKPCEPEWRVGEWGRCRACKKKGGVRIRPVQCVKKNPKPKGDGIITEDEECKDLKPGTVELCITRKKCGSRKRKASFVPAKFQETIWQQMNKLHLTKRGSNRTKVFLHGKSPKCTKRTTAFTWTGTPLKTVGKIIIDNEAEDDPNPVISEMKTMTLNETDNDSKIGGPGQDSILVHGTTRVVKGRAPKRYNTTKRTTTSKPKQK